MFSVNFTQKTLLKPSTLSENRELTMPFSRHGDTLKVLKVHLTEVHVFFVLPVAF